MQSTDYSLALLLAFLQLPDLVTDLFFCVRFFDTVRTNRTRELEMILVLQLYPLKPVILYLNTLSQLSQCT